MCQFGASMAPCRSSPPRTGARRATARKKCSCHWSCWSPPGRTEGHDRHPVAQRERGLRVVRGRRPGVRELGRPSSSQAIWSRVPSGKPSSGTTGLDCSQPPLGVAATMLPQRSTMSRWQVSPRVAPSLAHGRLARRRRAGMPSAVVPGLPGGDRASAWVLSDRRALPSGLPGRSSYEARSPMSSRRPRCCTRSRQQRVERTPRPRRRTRPRGRPSRACSPRSAGARTRRSRTAAAPRAAAGRAAGGRRGPGSRGRPCTAVQPFQSYVAGPRRSRPAGQVGGGQGAGVPFAAGVHGRAGPPAGRAPRR